VGRARLLITTAESGEQTTLTRPPKSREGSSVGKPVAIVIGNWKLLLAALANGFGRRANVVADDFVDRLTGRAEIKKVIHFRFRNFFDLTESR
jgi:hypothetical protein